MATYRSLKVKNFRCFNELTLSPLERVNLIGGVNNVGKSALLEALFIHTGGSNPALALVVNANRGMGAIRLESLQGAQGPWEWLFADLDTSRTIEVQAEIDILGSRTVRLRPVRRPEELAQIGSQARRDTQGPLHGAPISEVTQVLELEHDDGRTRDMYHLILDRTGSRVEPIPPAPAFRAFLHSDRVRPSLEEEGERFGVLELRNRQGVVLEALRLLEPRLRRVAMVVSAGQPMLHGEIAGLTRLMPLRLMGDGMVRLANLVIEMGNAEGGIVLVDEIENGLHHSMLPKVWQAVGKVAREFDTQVFATTHSWECIVAAHRAFSQSGKYDFRLHRLERLGGDIRAVTYDQEALDAAIESGLEVR